MTTKKVGSLFKQPDDVVAITESTTTVPNSPKRGKHLISGLYDPAAYRQFGVLAAELGLDKRELLREALNDLFIKHKKPPIA
ncbi:MAG: hypothetical protein RIQ94_519 [Pseudomonadota bacterium]|jgi:hypothetical protein